MNVAVIARPFQTSARWLIAGVIALALFAAALVHSAPVGAAVWCGGQYTTYCPLYAGYYPGYAGYAGYAGYPYGYAPNAVTYRQYTDNRSNCPDGQVTQTPTGYYCTNYGVAAFVPGSAPTYAGYYPGYPGYAGYNPGYAGYYPGYVVYHP
jgi:hypothetical protein